VHLVYKKKPEFPEVEA